MQEISAQHFDDVNGAGLANAIGYFVGYFAAKLGDVNLQGALEQGA